MDATRFDAWTRRRFGLAAGSVMVTVAGLASGDVARAKKKKLKRNRFGCVNVGGKCRGKDAVCCSGICDGKKPKKGEKDKSRCAAHDEGTVVGQARGCRASDDSCNAPDTFCTTSTGEAGRCFRTTGGAGYCLEIANSLPCTKDAQCIDSCGAGAACILCPASGEPDATCGGTTACEDVS